MSTLHPSDLRRIFVILDRDLNGRVSINELRQLLNRVGVSTGLDELEEIAGHKDLDLEEFVAFYESILLEDDGRGDYERDLLEAFKVFDLNNDGFISCMELKSVLSSLGLWDELSSDCTRMIGEFDTNSDGQLDFEEFKSMMVLRVGKFSEVVTDF